jgi:hypothetical protein
VQWNKGGRKGTRGEAKKGSKEGELDLMEVRSSNRVIPLTVIMEANGVSRDMRATQAQAASIYKSQAQSSIEIAANSRVGP